MCRETGRPVYVLALNINIFNITHIGIDEHKFLQNTDRPPKNDTNQINDSTDFLKFNFKV